MKSLALASRPQVLENWPVLISRTALFFELLKFCGALEKFDCLKNFCEDLFFFLFEDRLKNFCEDLLFFFILESTCACVLGPWPRAFLSLASRVSVLEKAVLGLGLGFFVSLALASSLVSSTPPLLCSLSFLASHHLSHNCKTKIIKCKNNNFSTVPALNRTIFNLMINILL